jgi:creatinine amidohydrolase
MNDRPSRYWQEWTTAEFEAADCSRLIALLPVAAIEQHGPHLPLEVDACINAGLIAETLDRLPADIPLVVLPAQNIGWSDEHGRFPGTLSIAPETLMAMWRSLAANVAKIGIRKFILFNSHGGQNELIKIVTRRLRIDHGMLATALNWYALADQTAMFGADERRFGIHGGAVETSLMLHFRPDLVRADLAEDFVSTAVEQSTTFNHLGPTGQVSYGWETQDLHSSGVVGDATAATAEKGRALADQVANRMAEVLQDIDGFDMARLADRPG